MSIFSGRHYPREVILWAVRWYCRYGISYRELEEMLTERGVAVDHVRLECQVSSGSSIVATTPGTGVDGLNLKVDVVRPLQGGTNAHIETFHKDGLQIISRQHGDITQADPSATFDFDRHHNLPYNYEYVGTKMVINTPLFSKGGNVALIVHR